MFLCLLSKNEKMKRKIFLVFIILIILIIAIFLWRDIYLPLNPHSTKVINFIIKKGSDAKEISLELKKEKLIRHSSIFRIYVLFSRASKKLQAGQYELSPSMSLSEIVKKIFRGEVIKKKITIIEGWNLKDIASYFEENDICSREEFIELTKKDFNGEFDILKDKPKDLSLEGYLFPDTYEIIPGTPPEEIIKKILSNFDKKLTSELKQEISRQKKTIFEIVTMASIIEKEVKTLEEKKIVSGIFWKRIKIGQPLQSCATINYITGKNNPAAFLKDIEIDSPYNTYKYYGLPLGPISNPGLDSIIAAIYPTETEYFYYLSTPEGKTIFSRTLKEHNAAKAKYLK